MNQAPDMMAGSLQMLAALLVVLAAVILAAWLARRFLRPRGTSGQGGLMQIVASQYLGPKKSVLLLEVPGAVLVLGVAGDGIRLLDKIVDRQLLERMTAKGGENPSPGFMAQLSRVKKHMQARG